MSLDKLTFKDNFSILIVGEETSHCEQLDGHLRGFGYKNTHIIYDRFQALALKNKFDLILFDLDMSLSPSGIELLTQFKECIFQQHLMVVAISVTEEKKLECIKLGVEDYLLKPLNVELLQARVDTCLHKKWTNFQESVQLEHLRYDNCHYEKLLLSLFPQRIVQEILQTGKPQPDCYKNVENIVNAYTYNTTPTAIYGVIGDPLTKSLGHIAYNSMLNSLNIPAIYIKFPVTINQLPTFMSWVKKMPIKGLSVTMPLKEQIVPYIDELDLSAQKIKSVNNLVFVNNKITGINTDGRGGLNAIENKLKVSGKKVALIGAGGAGIALASEAKNRGASVTLFDLDEARVMRTSQLLNCSWGNLASFPEAYKAGYDVLINATPSQMPIPAEFIIANTVVMDVSMQPKITTLLKAAREKGCSLVYGYEMFINQAILQTQSWFGDTINLEHAFSIMKTNIEQYLELSSHD